MQNKDLLVLLVQSYYLNAIMLEGIVVILTLCFNMFAENESSFTKNVSLINRIPKSTNNIFNCHQALLAGIHINSNLPITYEFFLIIVPFKFLNYLKATLFF